MYLSVNGTTLPWHKNYVWNIELVFICVY